MTNFTTPNTKQELREKILAGVPQTHCQSGCDGNGTYPEADEHGDAAPAQCEYCYMVRFPLADTMMQLLSDTVKKALDEVLTYKVQWVDGDQVLHPIVRVSAIEQVRKEWS